MLIVRKVKTHYYYKNIILDKWIPIRKTIVEKLASDGRAKVYEVECLYWKYKKK
jgi:hypothetical protein